MYYSKKEISFNEFEEKIRFIKNVKGQFQSLLLHFNFNRLFLLLNMYISKNK